MIQGYYRRLEPGSLDLTGVEWIGIARSVSVNGDTGPLIRHLRGGGHVGPELKALLADLLDGTIRGRPKNLPHHRWTPDGLKRAISEFAHLALGDRIDVQGDWEEAYDTVALDLADFGISTPTSRLQATTAAKKVLCGRLKITQSQLDEYLSSRQARRKSR